MTDITAEQASGASRPQASADLYRASLIVMLVLDRLLSRRRPAARLP